MVQSGKEQFEQRQGLIQHSSDTCRRVERMAEILVQRGLQPDIEHVYRRFNAADILMQAGCWLVVQMVYARHIHLDGRPFALGDFKVDPQGHAGGSLNMVPAYVAYLALNALTAETRAWMMGQGHCVSAVDSLNVLVDNMHPEHAARYGFDDAGLTQLCKDFYRYRVRPDGRPESPLGSHVSPSTAGGMLEGGYLGFADLHYVHAALPGEKLVAFLSDGAFEEQRGADWAPRWWRAEDTGLVVPVMIANGRRIDQRSAIMQAGGVDWLKRHLELNGFSPRWVDGRDPASFIVALFEAEEQLHAGLQELPYLMAEAPKGYGFLNAGTNLAHSTPLAHSPWLNEEARNQFNQALSLLWQPEDIIRAAVESLNQHGQQGRARERDHRLATRQPADLVFPQQCPDLEPIHSPIHSPMAAVDQWMVPLIHANSGLRFRLGNPDELRSNRMSKTLALLQHRVTNPEQGNDEGYLGQVITALNEEAVVCAALANKAGLNLVVSYEAFAVKMLGAIRQEIIFARHQKELGRSAQWHSVPIIVTSHTWENGKNEQSHQDPTLTDTLLGEMSDQVRVLYPADANSAIEAMQSVYAERGKLALLVIPKQDIPVMLTRLQAEVLSTQGALVLEDPNGAEVDLVAVGAYQLQEMRKAFERLKQRGVAARLVYVQEPARFREARDEWEEGVLHPEPLQVFPSCQRARIWLTHGRPEVLQGMLRPIDLGPGCSIFMGYRNRGGTLDVSGLLYANRCTWAHVLDRLSKVLGVQVDAWLDPAEVLAAHHQGDPYVLIPWPHGEHPTA